MAESTSTNIIYTSSKVNVT